MQRFFVAKRLQPTYKSRFVERIISHKYMEFKRYGENAGNDAENHL